MTAQSVPLETTKDKKKPIPDVIKEYIKTLKGMDVCRITDIQKGTLFYIPQDDSKQPCDILEGYFKDCYPKSNIDFSEYIGYIMASLPLIVGQYFYPSSQKYINRGIAKRLNKYKQYVPSDAEYIPPALFIELLDRLTPDRDENKYFTQWLAHIMQRPAERPTVAVMLSADEGTGKGILYNQFMTPLLMQQSDQCCAFDEIMDKHSTCLQETLLLMIDDATTNSDSTRTKLKSKISEPTTKVNPKGTQPYIQTVFTRVLLASNETRPLKLTKRDIRRWFAPKYINHKVSKPESIQFSNSVFEWLADPSSNALDHVYHYLMNVDLSDFNPFYIEPTETLLSMIELSTSYLESQVREVMDSTQIFKLDSFLSNERWKGKEDSIKKYVVDYWKKPRKLELEKGKGRSNWWVNPELTNSQAKELYSLM